MMHVHQPPSLNPPKLAQIDDEPKKIFEGILTTSQSIKQKLPTKRVWTRTSMSSSRAFKKAGPLKKPGLYCLGPRHPRMDYDLTQEVSLVLVDSLVANPLVRLQFEDPENWVYEGVSGLSGAEMWAGFARNVG